MSSRRVARRGPAACAQQRAVAAHHHEGQRQHERGQEVVRSGTARAVRSGPACARVARAEVEPPPDCSSRAVSSAHQQPASRPPYCSEVVSASIEHVASEWLRIACAPTAHPGPAQRQGQRGSRTPAREHSAAPTPASAAAPGAGQGLARRRPRPPRRLPGCWLITRGGSPGRHRSTSSTEGTISTTETDGRHLASSGVASQSVVHAHAERVHPQTLGRRVIAHHLREHDQAGWLPAGTGMQRAGERCHSRCHGPSSPARRPVPPNDVPGCRAAATRKIDEHIRRRRKARAAGPAPARPSTKACENITVQVLHRCTVMCGANSSGNKQPAAPTRPRPRNCRSASTRTAGSAPAASSATASRLQRHPQASGAPGAGPIRWCWQSAASQPPSKSHRPAAASSK